MKLLTLSLSLFILAGCSTAASRMQQCEDRGISRDTCYLAEQNRESANRAVSNSMAEQMAIRNAQEAKRRRLHHHYN